MAEFDPSTWSLFVRGAYTLGAVYLVLFFFFFTLFHRAAARVKAGEAGAIARYNRLLRGFPNAFYAKLLGRRRLESDAPGPPVR
jgi:hypothetical protein